MKPYETGTPGVLLAVFIIAVGVILWRELRKK